ncbi:MAG: hypothetical protein KAJ69_07100, partial [Thermoplasmatales archaeon]|nr:hypothetical protein [Thermoplasmatales archaeon]
INYILKNNKVNIAETWTHLHLLIWNLLNELLTFVLSSERRGKLKIMTPSPFLLLIIKYILVWMYPTTNFFILNLFVGFKQLTP